MDVLIVYGLVSLAALLLYYYSDDKSIDLKKQTTRRPVIKFRMYQIKKVKDKETQTESPVSTTPMSVSSASLDFPFDFDEDYLNGSNLFKNKCVTSPINGTTGSSETVDTMTGCETEL